MIGNSTQYTISQIAENLTNRSELLMSLKNYGLNLCSAEDIVRLITESDMR